MKAVKFPRPDMSRKVITASGTTSDIVEAVRNMFHKRAGDTAKLAPSLRRGTVRETAQVVFDTVNNWILYQLDPIGIQYILSPARALHQGKADCKGISILIASIFHNLGFTTGFRFTAYRPGGEYTHVYAIVQDESGKIIPVDPVWKGRPLTEKPYTRKRDYMTKIISLGATDGKPLVPIPPLENMTDGELMLWIAKAQREAVAEHTDRIRGIGNITSERIRDQVDFIDDAIEDMRTTGGKYLSGLASMAEAGMYRTAHEVAGIGAAKGRARRQQKRAERKARKANPPKSKPNRGLRRLVNKVKSAGGKVLKAVKKVAATPLRALISTTLPAAAPNFLYLFVTDPGAIAKLPANVRKKRKAQEVFATFMIKGLGMRQENFMGILRAGILKKFGKQPEKLLAPYIVGKKVAGIDGVGFVDDAFALIKKLVELVKKITGKKVGFDKSSVPDLENDWGSLPASEAADLARSVRNQAPEDFEESADDQAMDLSDDSTDDQAMDLSDDSTDGGYSGGSSGGGSRGGGGGAGGRNASKGMC